MNERTGYSTPPPINWQFIIMNYPFSIMNYEFIIMNRSPPCHLIINTYNIILNYELYGGTK